MNGEASSTGAMIWAQQDLTRPQMFALGIGSIAVYTARAPGKTVCSEDAVALIPAGHDSWVLAVADGVGGQPDGEKAAKLTLEMLCERVLSAVDSPASIMQAITGAINQANLALLARASNAATTLAVAEVRGTVMRAYQVGDSMTLVAGRRGKIRLQTAAHSPVGQALASGALDEMQAMRHPQRNLVSNVIGMEGMRIEVSPSLTLASHDTLLVASDGLTDNLYVREIVERARSAPLDEAALRLIEDSQRRMEGGSDVWSGHADDLSFVLFRPRAPIVPRGRIGG